MENLENKEKKSFIDKYAKILVIVAVFCGGASGPIGSLVSAPVSAIGFWRLSFALPFFLIPVLSNSEKREKLFNVDRKNLILSMISGAFLFIHYTGWYTAVKQTNVSSAAILASFHPLVVLFITIFIYKKRVGIKSIIAILVALAGGAYTMCSDLSALQGSKLGGNIAALVAGIAMGIYFALGGKVREKIDGSIYVLICFASCWACFGISNAVQGNAFFGYPGIDYVYILCLALICQIGSHAVWNLCMGHVSSLYVSTWETGDPVVSTILAIILIGQFPTTTEIIGCIIVVGALLCYNRFESETEQKEAQKAKSENKQIGE